MADYIHVLPYSDTAMTNFCEGLDNRGIDYEQRGILVHVLAYGAGYSESDVIELATEYGCEVVE